MKTQPRYVCIHGHFYQPPRENPWLEAIELQESADPFHDWNERITAECYMPNSSARIQGKDGHILGIINNYARMSFNFGPSLLSWMEFHNPNTYRAILDADKESIERFGGHGSAMAQVYNHIIMPLANTRDQETQIIWGLRDFEQRFGRKPEGMWLAEAAVSTETLELLVAHGIKFTVLAPNQASAVRPIAANGAKVPNVGWEDVSGRMVDPARAYLCPLPNGTSITLFFYDGPISQAVAFEGILKSGETFAKRLISGFSDDRDYPQLLHIATDGETYGHHHKFGDMALAYALHYIEANNLAKLTNYGQFMELHPPTWEVRICDNSSWSCSHGVERWSDDCGCSSGMHQGWSQQWRRPLRKSLDWLRDSINPVFETEAAEIYDEPWLARDAYIDVVLHRSPETVDTFMQMHARPDLLQVDREKALQLMELQRQLMLMYTSCGWFFDELSGLETVQIMQYASRAIQLAEQSLGLHLEKGFIKHLKTAKSNIRENRDGALIYEKYVRPAKVDLVRVGAHFAVTNLFKPETENQHIYAFSIDTRDWLVHDSGLSRVALGRAHITSDVTSESQEIAFAVLHLGDHHLTAGVRDAVTDSEFADLTASVVSTLNRADLPNLIRLLDQKFNGLAYSLVSLFKDERQIILNQILEKNLQQAESTLRMVFNNNAALMRFLATVNAPHPDILNALGRFIIGGEVRKLLDENVPDPQRLLQLIDEAKASNLPLDSHGVELSINHAIEKQTNNLRMRNNELHAMRTLIAMGNLAVHLPYPVNFWQAQNIIFQLQDTRYIEQLNASDRGEVDAREWVKLYRQLSDQLKVKIDD